MAALAYGVVVRERHHATRVFACAIGLMMAAIAIEPFFTGVIRFKGGRSYLRRRDPRKFHRVACLMLAVTVAIVTLGVGLVFLS